MDGLLFHDVIAGRDVHSRAVRFRRTTAIMRMLRSLTVFALVCTPAAATSAETMMIRKVHTDAYTLGSKEMPAKDVTQTIWIGKDRVRMDGDEMSFLYRGDQKKLYVIHPTEKTYSTLDLPIDLAKYVPPEVAPMIEKMKVTAKVTPTDETRKIGDWNAKKYTFSMQMMMGAGSTQDIWTTKDITMDASAYLEMQRMLAELIPGGASVIDEMKKMDGVPVLSEKTRKVMGASVKERDELVSVAQKDAPAGTFEMSKEYTEKPFDLMQMGMGGGMKPGSKGPPPGK
jgi:hypothetical protein